MAVQFDDTQKLPVTVAAVDDNGNTVATDAAPVWTSSNPGSFTVDTADGLTGFLVSAGAGTGQLLVEAVVNGVTLTATLDVEVRVSTPSPPPPPPPGNVTLVITPGTPEPK